MSTSPSSKGKAALKGFSEQGIINNSGLILIFDADEKLELQQTLSRLQNELQALGSKITELESEADEHEYASTQSLLTDN